MNTLTLEKRILVVRLYFGGSSFRNIQDTLAGMMDDVRIPSVSSLHNLVTKFLTCGSVRTAEDNGGENDIATHQNAELVIACVTADPTTSVRQVENDIGVPKSTVQKNLKQEGWHPYKISKHQELLPNDLLTRSIFCEEMMERSNANRNFLKNICFTDECTFTLHGEPNSQNSRYWALENPHKTMATRTQYPQKVNVWTGILGGHIVGPFFIDGNLNGVRYLQLLQDQIVPAINNIQPDLREVWYQQDGCPAHCVGTVTNYLSQTFGGWIGRNSPISWPPRSPDLAPCDFFLWGHLKSKIYKTQHNTIEDLKTSIRQECGKISNRQLANVRRGFYDRLGYSLAQRGQQFEFLL